MSHYGIHFGLFTLADGSERLVMVDQEGAWQPLAAEMGFTQSKWLGLYVMMKNDLETGRPVVKLTIPRFASRFPMARQVQVPVGEIREGIKPLLARQTKFPLSQHRPGARRLSWHPDRREEIAPAEETPAGSELAKVEDVKAALAERTLLGLNALGHEVYDLGTGLREIVAGDVVTSERDASDVSGALFLRAESDAELQQVAAGMVRLMEAGQALGAEDFARYVDAAGGEGAAADTEKVRRFHKALEAAVSRVVLDRGTGIEAFEAAMLLHETRPSYWNPAPKLTAPAPLMATVRALIANHPAVQALEGGATIAAIDDRPLEIDGEVSVGIEAPHHVSVSTSIIRVEADEKSGVRKPTYTEVHNAWASLQARDPKGVSAFWLPIERAGRVDPVARRFLTNVGRTHSIEAVLDLHPQLLGAGQAQATRLVVVGEKLAVENHGYATPLTTHVANDYAEVWATCEKLTKGAGQDLRFGDSDGTINRWQAPYIPASQVTEPETMMPRNLIAPVRQALTALTERTGKSVDDFVSEKLGWTAEEMGKHLSAEQVDAVALAIDAIDQGGGFINTDETGIGKGRAAAAVALYAKRAGNKVIFLTGSADLFSDFYRDVSGIGAMKELGNPFLVNSSHIIRDLETGSEIARSPSSETQQAMFACGDFPSDHSLVMATYSQFNRRYDRTEAKPATEISRTLRAMINEGLDSYEAIRRVASHLGMPDYAALGFQTPEGAAEYELRLAETSRRVGQTLSAEAHDANAKLLNMSKAELMEALASRVRVDSTTLKHQWLYSGALDGAVIISDESHLAAGETSQTGVNIQHLVNMARASAFLSATYSKDVNNFQLYAPLFPKSIRVHTIADTLKRGGEVMQERLSAMLAADGKLIRREHDLSGIIYRTVIDEKREARNLEWAKAFGSVMSALTYLSGEVSEQVRKQNEAYGEQHKQVQQAAARAKSSGKGANSIPAQGVQYTNFSSKFYNITRVFLMAINADHSADLALEALAAGRKPILAVENTLDSVLKELVDGVDAESEDLPDASPAQLTGTSALNPQKSLLAAEGPNANGFVALGRRVGFKDILLAYVDSLFEARLQTKVGAKVTESKRISLLTPELEEARNEIRKLVEAMPEIPLSPLDHVRAILKERGYTVGEISGRKYQLVETEDGNHAVARYPSRKRQNVVREFNDGTLDVGILSLAGSYGISMHASSGFADQRQRELIEMQRPRSTTNLKQIRGRVTRKGSVNDPMVTSPSSGLPAEARLLAMQNSAFRKMSANTSGSADNASLKEDVPDLLNRIGNEVAFRWMEANPKVSSIIGYKIGEVNEATVSMDNTKFIDLLTARLVMLDPALQFKVWEELTAEYKAVIEQYELEGSNPLQAATLDLRAATTSELTLQEATGRQSVFDGPVVAREITYEYDLPALERDVLLEAAAKGRAALVESHGQNFAQAISANIKQKALEALPDLLPSRFSTIEEALADANKNAVKNALLRYEWFEREVLDVTPGSVINYRESDNAGGVSSGDGDAYESVFVTGWKLPKGNDLALSEFKIQGISLKTRKPVEMSMSAWNTRQGKSTSYTYDPANPYPPGNMAEVFFKRAQLPQRGTQSRMVLTGNIYRAAEMADSQRTGASVSYSDANGTWHHGILLPKGFTLANVNLLPVVVGDADTLIAALAGRGPGDHPFNVTDDTRSDINSKRTYLVAGRPGALEIFLTGDKANWLSANKQVRECLVGGTFTQSRTSSRARVRPGREAEFLTAFMNAANAAQAQVVLPGHMRAWHNKHLASIHAPKVSQKTADEALSDKAHDDIAAILASAM